VPVREQVTEKLKSGYVVREEEGATHEMRQEGVPREPMDHHKQKKKDAER
jgi:hypothetical protein